MEVDIYYMPELRNLYGQLYLDKILKLGSSGLFELNGSLVWFGSDNKIVLTNHL